MIDVITKIMQHVYFGDYNTAKKLIMDELSNKPHVKTVIILNIIICKIHIKEGDYYSATKVAEKSLEISTNVSDAISEFKLNIIKIEALLKQYDLKTSHESLAFLDNLLKTIQRVAPSFYDEALGSLYFIKGYYFRFSHDLQTGLRYYEKSIELRRFHQEKYGLAESLNHLGITHWMLGNFSKSLDSYDESYKLFTKLGDKITSIGVTINIGLVYRETGRYSDAKKIYSEGLQLSKRLNNIRLISALSSNIGLVHIDLGNYDLAEDNLLNAIRINLELNDKNVLVHNYVNLGIVYDFKWLFDKSLEFYDKCISISKEIENNNIYALALHNKALVLRKLNKNKLSLQYSMKAIEISKKLENSPNLIKYYYELILTHIALKNEKSAKFYLNILATFKDNLDTDQINFAFKLASSFILKSSRRVINQAEAQKILSEIISYENIPHEYEFEALQSLCEILINEAKLESNEEINTEIAAIIKRIRQLSEEKNSYIIKISALILESQTSFIMGDTKNSVQCLETAKSIANNEGVPFLSKKIESVETFHKMRIREMQVQVEKGKIDYKTDDEEINDYIDYINNELPELQINYGRK